MNDRKRLHNIVRDLNIPRGRWCLAGSGVMVLHGIERRMRDVDIYCATQTWFSLMRQRTEKQLHSPSEGRGAPTMWESSPTWEVFTTDPDDAKSRCDPPYLYRVMYDIEVNIFFSWRRRGVGDIDVAFWLHNTQDVDGIPCLPLQFLLDWKEEVGRDKDVGDIHLIRQHLAKTGAK